MSKNEVQLKQGTLSLSNCIMIAVGGMVGSAIFALSGLTFRLAGPAAILSWVIAGLILFLYALNLAELATTFPKSGGIFNFPYQVLGKSKKAKTFWGWLSAWSWLNVAILGMAFSSIYVATYLNSIIPGIEQYKILIAILWIALCWFLNVIGISFMGKINFILTLGLILICLVYVVFGIGHIDSALYKPFFTQGIVGESGWIAAIPVAMLAYGSIIAIGSIAEEIKNPQRTIPRALGYSVLITVIMYCLVLFVTYGLYRASDFADGSSWGIFAPLSYGIVTAMPKMMWLNALISIGAVVAITTTILILTMDSGRNIMAAAQSGLLPESLGKIHPKTKTPVAGITLASVIAAIIACFPQFTMQIVNTGGYCILITIFIITITLLALRKKSNNGEVDQSNAFKTPGGLTLPIITLIVLVLTFILTFMGDMGKSYIIAIWWYVAGLILFLIALVFNKSRLK